MVKASIPGGGAVFMALETAVLSGHDVLFDAYEGALKAQGVELTPVLYTRFLLDADRSAGLVELAAFLNTSFSDDTLDQVVSAATEAFLAPKKVNPVAIELMNAVTKAGMPVHMMTRMSAEQAAGVFVALGVGDCIAGVLSFERSGVWHFSVDEWKQALIQARIYASVSFAIVASAQDCRSALSARLRCAVLTSPLVEAQDFGGSVFAGATLSPAQAVALCRG